MCAHAHPYVAQYLRKNYQNAGVNGCTDDIGIMRQALRAVTTFEKVHACEKFAKDFELTRADSGKWKLQL